MSERRLDVVDVAYYAAFENFVQKREGSPLISM